MSRWYLLIVNVLVSRLMWLWGQYFSVLRLAEGCGTHWGGPRRVVRDVVPENEAEGDAMWRSRR